jgi:hypothetical protein
VRRKLLIIDLWRKSSRKSSWRRTRKDEGTLKKVWENVISMDM